MKKVDLAVFLFGLLFLVGLAQTAVAVTIKTYDFETPIIATTPGVASLNDGWQAEFAEGNVWRPAVDEFNSLPHGDQVAYTRLGLSFGLTQNISLKRVIPTLLALRSEIVKMTAGQTQMIFSSELHILQDHRIISIYSKIRLYRRGEPCSCRWNLVEYCIFF